ncbi:hypothetical protein [Crocosphaera sp. Alani8]|uniref:hypothetical protein n=1 Tax=Crocosphaera sp. Alani8 TaxID=3038952 RepID=UPI00313D5AA7
MESNKATIEILPKDKKNEEPHKSLDPLAENFDFDSWAKMVKKQMNKSLQYPFSHYLSK